jgi:hypothetical protein
MDHDESVLPVHKLNYQQLNLVYLPRNAKLYGCRRKGADARIREGLKMANMIVGYLKIHPNRPRKNLII